MALVGIGDDIAILIKMYVGAFKKSLNCKDIIKTETKQNKKQK